MAKEHDFIMGELDNWTISMEMPEGINEKRFFNRFNIDLD